MTVSRRKVLGGAGLAGAAAATGVGVDRLVSGYRTDKEVSLADDAARFQGSVYMAIEGSGASTQRLMSDPQSNRPSTEPIKSPSQTFSYKIFKDPSGKAPDQLLAATSDGVMKLQGRPTLTRAMSR